MKTETRKLFLPAHQRYYLVTLELHCDAAGFPSVTPDQIDQCGFVLRRRVTDIPSGQEREVATMLADLTLARARLSSNAQVDAARLRSAPWYRCSAGRASESSTRVSPRSRRSAR